MSSMSSIITVKIKPEIDEAEVRAMTREILPIILDEVKNAFLEFLGRSLRSFRIPW